MGRGPQLGSSTVLVVVRHHNFEAPPAVDPSHPSKFPFHVQSGHLVSRVQVGDGMWRWDGC
jgi:hypothetical protein